MGRVTWLLGRGLGGLGLVWCKSGNLMHKKNDRAIGISYAAIAIGSFVWFLVLGVRWRLLNLFRPHMQAVTRTV